MEQEILHFEVPDISHAACATSILQRHSELCCEGAFANALIWQKYYGHRVAFDGDALYMKLYFGGRHIFLLPFCDDMRAGCEKIFAYCRHNNIPLFFLAAEGERLNRFRSLYGESFLFNESRDDFEYIYTREKLATLKGKKFHSKRNHISAFSKKHDWSFEAIDDTNADEVLAMSEIWVKAHYDGTNPSLLVEQESLKTLLRNRELLGIKGGLIRTEGKVVAFTIASPIGKHTYDVHMEKALTEYSTAYTVINRAFAQYLNCTYLNREDDMGLEGLRKAKLSYQPDILLKKYTCVYRGDA
ncbi:MAG: DUF2156 domain-containing protein [Clostridia bacterium]|nr:DUF2156 domain-containing protein [Clostridia bacterium]